MLGLERQKLKSVSFKFYLVAFCALFGFGTVSFFAYRFWGGATGPIPIVSGADGPIRTEHVASHSNQVSTYHVYEGGDSGGRRLEKLLPPSDNPENDPPVEPAHRIQPVGQSGEDLDQSVDKFLSGCEGASSDTVSVPMDSKIEIKYRLISVYPDKTSAKKAFETLVGCLPFACDYTLQPVMKGNKKVYRIVIFAKDASNDLRKELLNQKISFERLRK